MYRGQVRIAMVALAGFCLLASAAAAQDTAGVPADSAARAKQVLEGAVAALGGRDAVLGARYFDVSYASWALGSPASWQQARSATEPAPIGPPNDERWVVDLANQRGLREINSVAPGGIRFHIRAVADTAGGFTVDLLKWRRGTDIFRQPAQLARSWLPTLERLAPHLAVRQALRQDSSLRYLGETQRGGRRVHSLGYTDRAGVQVTLDIDAETLLPAAITPGTERNTGTAEFSYYRTVDGVQVPFSKRIVTDGHTQEEVRVTRASLRPVPDSLFRVPAGYTEPPIPGEPHATRVAEGVYRLDDMPGGYHAAFVVRDDHIAVLEAPVNPQWTETALRVMEETAPGKSVRYVFLTHHHSDHVGGLAPYVARGATVVAGPGVDDAVRRQLPDSLRAEARFEVVDSSRTFGSGPGRIHAFAVPNTHAEGNLAYHLPAHGILFQGDLFYLPERGEVPPAFEVTESLANAVGKHGLSIRSIVGVHGRTGTWDDLQLSLRRREAGATGR